MRFSHHEREADKLAKCSSIGILLEKSLRFPFTLPMNKKLSRKIHFNLILIYMKPIEHVSVVKGDVTILPIRHMKELIFQCY